jgi:CRP-like cAMP-binding protein/thioredoxin reductase/Fe-S-cluster-containing hydrogenase component 2
MSNMAKSDMYEVAIVGAGPGGIGAATNAAHHGLSHVLFEKAEIANTIYDYQLKKLVMAEPTRLPLRAYVEFSEGTREQVLGNFKTALEETKTNLVKGEVQKIERSGEGFVLSCGGTTYRAKAVVLAVGNMGTPRKLGAPGEDLPHIAYTLSDPSVFTNTPIAIIGAGDSAIENALALCEKNIVSIVNRRAEFPRAKDANRRKILEAIKQGKIRCFYDTSIKECTPEELVLNTPDGEVRIPCTHVIVRAGNIPPREFVEDCGVTFPSADPAAFPAVNERYESNVPGLYIVGALIGYPLIKQAINQGYEVVEHILGNPIEPADLPLIEEVVAPLGEAVPDALARLRKVLRLFARLSSPQFRELLIDSKIHILNKGDTVFEKDAYGDSFWNVISGSVAVLSPFNPDELYRLVPGNFFGEMGLMSGRRRTASVRAYENQTILLETKRNQILKLIGAVPSVKQAIDQVFFLRILKATVFPSVDARDLAEVVARSESMQFNKGEILFKEGEPGDALYIILKGSVKVSRRGPQGIDIAQTYIPAGNYVGEMALVNNAPRSATVSAAVRCEVLKIPADLFAELLDKNPETRQAIATLAKKRVVENITAARDSFSGGVLDFVLQQGVSDADNVLLIDSNLCVGCDNCEKACASTHNGYSRLDRKGGKSFASIQVPISCRHCENPLCMLDCPPDALLRKSNGEVVIKDTCIGCGNCATNCPYGVIQLVYDDPVTPFFSPYNIPILKQLLPKKHKEKGPAKAAKCDMCETLDGGPACVRSCPTGAAIRVNPQQMMSLMLEKKGSQQ